MEIAFEDSTGIVTWATTIHNRLANDSTRAVFKEFVQVQGLLFLDEYLEGVLAGSKDQSVIEIAKTPGRKRHAFKNTRAAAANESARKQKLAALNDKENLQPSKPSHLTSALMDAAKTKDEDAMMDRNDIPSRRAPLSVSISLPATEPSGLTSEHHQPSTTPVSTHAPLQGFLSTSITESSNQDLSIIQEQEEESDKPFSVVQEARLSASRSTLADPRSLPRPSPSAFSLQPELSRPSPSNTPAVAPMAVDAPKPEIEKHSKQNVAPSPIQQPMELRAATPVDHPRKTSGKQPGMVEPVVFAPAPVPRPSNPLPPAPKLRSSWLVKGPEHASGLPSGAKKSLGATLVAQAKKSVGMGLVSAGVKRKSDLDEDDALMGRKSKASKTAPYGVAGGSTHPLAGLPQKRYTEAEGAMEVDITEDIGASRMYKASRGPAAALSRDDHDWDHDHTTRSNPEPVVELQELREKIALAQRGVRHSVDIDVTGRFNVPLPPLKSIQPVPQEEDIIMETSTASIKGAQTERNSTASNADQSGSHTRLSVSELVSMDESKRQDSLKKLIKKHEVRPSYQAQVELAVAKGFTLLVDSTKSSTTPPHSPQSTSQQRPNAVAQPEVSAPPPPPQIVKSTKPKSDVPQKAEVAGDSTSTDPAYGQLSEWEEMMLGMKSTSQPEPVKAPRVVIANETTVPQKSVPMPTVPADVFKPTPPKAAPGTNSNPFVIPEDLFKMPAPPTAQNLGAPSLTRQSSIQTVSTQDSYADSIFSQQKWPKGESQGSYNDVYTQPTEYSASQDQLVPSQDVKGKSKAVDPVTTRMEGVNVQVQATKGATKIAGKELARAKTPTADELEPSSSYAGIGSSILGFAAKVLGSAKKTRPEPKVELKASSKPDYVKAMESANAARKEQEEKEKRSAQTKDAMEQRRREILQKKAEEEQRVRQQEMEKKQKDEERRKREREETRLKKPEDDPSKKRKLTVEIEKKELRKPPSKDKLNASFQASASTNGGRTNPVRPSAQPSSSQQSSKGQAKKPSSAQAGPSYSKLPPAFAKPSVNVLNVAGKSAPKAEAGPSELVAKPVATTSKTPAKPVVMIPSRPNAETQARLEAVRAAKAKQEAMASEQIELPEINSEYSDSDDEDRHKDLPDWAQDANLIEALQRQRHRDPDDIFGPVVREVDMAKIFARHTRQSKFRNRTSSANWDGPDGLTEREALEYARRMGFK